MQERAKGKLRHLGVTETASDDPEHEMLQRAVEDEVWDVVMAAFHMMHQNARANVFPRTMANRVGTLVMFAVRNIFSRPERLAAALRELTARRELPRWLADSRNPLGFLLHEAGASTITEAAYRFVATSQVSMSFCSAPATRIICGLTSLHCSRPRSRWRTGKPSPSCSSVSSESGSTRPTACPGSAPHNSESPG